MVRWVHLVAPRPPSPLYSFATAVSLADRGATNTSMHLPWSMGELLGFAVEKLTVLEAGTRLGAVGSYNGR